MPKKKPKLKVKPLHQTLENGEPWFLRQDFYISCCDCGLRHHVLFEVTGKNTIMTRWYRDQGGTMLNRTFQKHLCKPPGKRRKDKKRHG